MPDCTVHADTSQRKSTTLNQRVELPQRFPVASPFMPHIDKMSNGVHSYGSFTLHGTGTGNVNGSDGFQYIHRTVHTIPLPGTVQGMGSETDQLDTILALGPVPEGTKQHAFPIPYTISCTAMCTSFPISFPYTPPPPPSCCRFRSHSRAVWICH